MVRTSSAAERQSGNLSPRKAWNTVPEVYSRITGYYRPVKNWNDGKSQEYKERKVYDVGSSVLKHSGPVQVEAAPAAPAEKPLLADGVYLFASPTCPNCKVAESLLGKAGISYTKLMAQENVALFEALGIRQAPTLVVVEAGNVEKYVSVANVKKFIAAATAVE